MLYRLWREDEGVLTFEWILLITLLVIGIVGGLSAVRDAINHELGDVAGAIVSVDQSYTVSPPLDPTVICGSHDGANGFYFTSTGAGGMTVNSTSTTYTKCPTDTFGL